MYRTTAHVGIEGEGRGIPKFEWEEIKDGKFQEIYNDTHPVVIRNCYGSALINEDWCDEFMETFQRAKVEYQVGWLDG